LTHYLGAFVSDGMLRVCMFSKYSRWRADAEPAAV